METLSWLSTPTKEVGGGFPEGKTWQLNHVCIQATIPLPWLLPLAPIPMPLADLCQVSQVFHLHPSKFLHLTPPTLSSVQLLLPPGPSSTYMHTYPPSLSFSLCLHCVVKNQFVKSLTHCTCYSWFFTGRSHTIYSYLSLKSSVPINDIIWRGAELMKPFWFEKQSDEIEPTSSGINISSLVISDLSFN